MGKDNRGGTGGQSLLEHLAGVDVLDHVIFAGGDYLSLKRRGQF